MRTLTSFATVSAIVASMYHAPMTTLLITIATVFALDLIGLYCTHQQQQVDQGNAAYDEIKDLFQAVEDIMAQPHYQDTASEASPADLWDTTEVTSCELACPVRFSVQPVLALAPAMNVIVEEVVIIDYTALSYREVQAKVKALRTDASIKLNTKKSVLVAWLQANA